MSDHEARTERDSSRRRLLKAGALAVPSILTLHASPAWAGTDYTLSPYRYGVNAGRCRNPNFDPNAAPGSAAGEEFVSCPDIRNRKGGGSSVDTGTENTSQSGGLTQIKIN